MKDAAKIFLNPGTHHVDTSIVIFILVCFINKIVTYSCVSNIMSLTRRSLSSLSKCSNLSSSFGLSQVLNLLNRKKKSLPVINEYKRSTHPTSVPINKLFSGRFPLPLKQSINDYNLRHDPLKFQHDLLSALPFYPNQDSLGRSSEVIQTQIEDGKYINEFVIYPSGYKPENYQKSNHLIMIHGYGAGLGFFLKNFNEISKLNWIIHSIDLLGYGCSSRPRFELKKHDLDHVESWFHDSFNTWLHKRNLNQISSEKVMIVAHSMGAYLISTYGLKNPDFCKKLIMVSPGAVIKHRKPIKVPKYFAKLWEKNISPFSLVRKAGPLGSKLVSGWSSRRFAKLPRKESNLLHRYAYAIFQSPGSGEYMLNYLLAPGADARFPLINRGIEKLNCSVSWWYGREDWMDVHGGRLCSKKINDYHGEERSDVLEIEDSGHHLYLDNYKKFNSLLNEEMRKF